ncbi:hillarin-like [Ostrea edulis]|uniref:hillarin-like n=1 Tax=Ostrea edulis TaxID=37623 RepID=UPI0024AF4168|nr:hillarin-like [Ostrea edulis]
MDDQYSSDSDDGDGFYSSQNKDTCYRCQKRVYPVERVDVGVLFHRRCFRCRVCGLQLTLRTFRWQPDGQPADVYCHGHLPKIVGIINKDSMGIQSALNAPKLGVHLNEQIRGSTFNPGWQYDANALEFSHQRELNYQRKQRTSFGTYQDFESLGVFDAQTELERRQQEEEDRLYSQLTIERRKRITSLESEIKQEKDKSVKDLVTNFEKKIEKTNKDGLEKESQKIEEIYNRKREEKLKHLLDKLSEEEKIRVSQLIEKHSHEMLFLIAEKLCLSELSSSDSDCSSPPTINLCRPPPIAPPEFRRSALFKSPGELEHIDEKVVNIAKTDYSSFTDLVKNLMHGCTSDLEKARALFRWICLKDLNKIEIDDTVSSESPLGILRGIKQGTETYHDLFKRLCSYAGLYCEIIKGYSKGAGYKPGMKFEGPRFRNSWTAVFLEGSWCFINCNWGARHVKCTKNTTFYYRSDEFYFITDPEDHIYQHFPDNPKWQLLECPVTLSEFINLPVVKSPFFNHGIKFANHYDCTQYTNKGLVVLQFNIPNLLGFGYTFEAKDVSLTPNKLEGRAMIRIIGHKAIFTVAPPKAGKYYFTIYVKENWNCESLQSACAFTVKCRERREHIKSPFPMVPFFGPTPLMSKLDIAPLTHIDPLVVYSYDDVFLRFKVPKNTVLTYTCQYYGPFQCNITDFQRYTFLSKRDHESVTFQIRCPVMGKYVLSVFGSGTTSTDENSVPEILFRYLIDCKQPGKDKRALPRACHRWQGNSLIEPIVGDIPLGIRMTFRVCAPKALDVALLAGNIWHHFRELPDNMWVASVFTGTEQCRAKIYAKFSQEKCRFSPLVEFHMK